MKDLLLHSSDKGLYVFYDFKTTQNTEYTEDAKLHIPNLVCVQHFCSRYEDVEDGDCVRCGKTKDSFWEDSVGGLLTYLTEPRPLGQ